MAITKINADAMDLTDNYAFTGTVTGAGGGDLSFDGDTFGADKTIGSNDNYALSLETNNTERLKLTNDGRGLSQFTIKVWINFDGGISSSVSIRDSYNVSSITDNGTGDYTVTFANAMANTNYCCNSVVWLSTGTSSSYSFSYKSGAMDQQTGSVRLQGNYGTDSSAAKDSDIVTAQIFGD